MKETLLCIVSHPDDETMLTGGLLAMLAEHGVAVHILCATRGEGGEAGDPPLVKQKYLGKVREQELLCAAGALGAITVRIMDYVDPPVGKDGSLHPYTDRFDELINCIAEVIEEVQPTLLLTHGSKGEYGHPAHVLTHRAVVQAHTLVRKQGLTPYFYTFCAAIPGRDDRIFNPDDPASVVLDVTPWLEIKAEAAACYRTQHALFFRNHPEANSLHEVVRTTESLHRVWSPNGPDAPIFTDWITHDDDACD